MFTAAPADARARGTAIFVALCVASTFALTEVAWATGDGHKRGDDNARCAKYSGKKKSGAKHHGHKNGRKAGDCKPPPPPPPPPKGKVVITKQTHPDHSTQAFTFTAPGLDADGFALKDDESATFEQVTPGTYTVTENATPGWTLKRIACEASGNKPSKDEDHKGDHHGSPKNDDHGSWKGDELEERRPQVMEGPRELGEPWRRSPGRPVPTTGNAVTINVAAGQTVSCVFKNKQVPAPPPAKIVVTKMTVPPGANASFAFTAPVLDADGFALSHGQSATFGDLAAGTYVVTEESLAGWTLQTLACTDPTADTTTAGAVATIKVAAGETVTCTYTNAPTPTVTTPVTPAAPVTTPQPTTPDQRRLAADTAVGRHAAGDARRAAPVRAHDLPREHQRPADLEHLVQRQRPPRQDGAREQALARADDSPDPLGPRAARRRSRDLHLQRAASVEDAARHGAALPVGARSASIVHGLTD